MDINQNISACLQSTNNIGSTVIHNVCNGATSVVPWGSGDWTGMIVLGLFGAVFIGFFATMFYKLATDF